MTKSGESRKANHALSALDGIREKYIKQLIELKKWDDPNVRYSCQYVVEYLEKACRDNYFIEAYCIAQQYVIHTIEILFPGLKFCLRNRKISEGYLISFLGGVGIINSELSQKWEKLVRERNQMAHDLIDNFQKISKISQTEKNERMKFLIGCIDAADAFFANRVKGNILSSEKLEVFCAGHLAEVLIRRARAVNKDFFELPKKKTLNLLKKEFLTLFGFDKGGQLFV